MLKKFASGAMRIGRGLDMVEYAITSPHNLQTQLASYFLQIIPILCLAGGVMMDD